MKWPATLTLIRHDTSAYNVLKDQKASDPTYVAFLAAQKKDWRSKKTRQLAQEVWEKFALRVGDQDTPLANEGRQAIATGRALAHQDILPDVVFVSPYLRAQRTFELLAKGWPALALAKKYDDERIREQDHGLAGLYSDWRVFQTLHPEQQMLYDQLGSYWYCYPQGENVPDMRERNRSWIGTLVREFAGKHVMAVTHHLNILAIRANQERLNAEEFIRLDKKEKPINCGVTLYRGYPKLGKDGRLVLEYYNKKCY